MQLIRSKPEPLATIGLYLFAGSLFVLALALYKAGALGDLWAGTLRVYGSAGILGALLAAILLIGAYRQSKPDRRGKFWLPLALNLVVVVFCLGGAEIALRILAKPGPYSLNIGSITLLPHEWEKVVETNLQHVNKGRDKEGVLSLTSGLVRTNEGRLYTNDMEGITVEDDELGWTIGASRTSKDGMYKSSAEGIRSAEQGASFAASDPRRRIAVLGNSMTFGQDVSFEDSWGYFLERSLPAGTRVLNFGVPGYGVDQAYLRFERDALKWNPAVTVFAFIQDDIWRVGGVYPFFRGWLGPSKPRFILDGENLKLLNSPTVPPEKIFASRSVFDLPFLQYDMHFIPHQWDTDFIYSLYLARFLVTKFPRWQEPSDLTSDATVARLASRIVQEFYSSAQAQGTKPVIVYFPSRYDFRSNTNYGRETVLASLKQNGIPVTDLTPCLLARVSKDNLFLAGKFHFGREGNAAAAECIRTLIWDKLPA